MNTPGKIWPISQVTLFELYRLALGQLPRKGAFAGQRAAVSANRRRISQNRDGGRGLVGCRNTLARQAGVHRTASCLHRVPPAPVFCRREDAR